MNPITEICDDNGNVATISYWGSEDAARASLATLVDCKNCRDCSGCSYCSLCSNCSDCSYCSYCSLCSDCSGCSYCSNCSSCSYCSSCSSCSNCSDCSCCSDCSGCSGKAGDHEQPKIPIIRDIHQSVYAAANAPGALNMQDWHTCDTTHCRAGWVIALAGDEGRTLEAYWGTPHAAWLIYKASDPEIKAYPNFYATNAGALEDMRRLAEQEAAR